MIDSIKQILIQGARSVFHNVKFVALMWAMNAISALVLAVPVFNILMDNLGNSLTSEHLAHSFDYFWYLQFRNLYSTQLDQLPLGIYFAVGVYALIQTFFLGGLISVFHIPDKNHTVDFFFGGVRYFARFVKVLLISLLFFAAAFKINDFTGELITLLLKSSENVVLDFISKFIRYVLMIFFIGIVTIISDYSKISMAVRDKTQILKEIYHAVIFLKNNFNKIFVLFLVVAIIGAFGAVIYNVIGRFIPRTPFYFLTIIFILQQMLIIFRLLVRMLFYSTQVSLFKDLNADTIKVEQ